MFSAGTKRRPSQPAFREGWSVPGCAKARRGRAKRGRAGIRSGSQQRNRDSLVLWTWQNVKRAARGQGLIGDGRCSGRPGGSPSQKVQWRAVIGYGVGQWWSSERQRGGDGRKV